MTVGYTACSCRDCFEIAIGVTGEALCNDCEDAECEAGADQECRSPYAYEEADDEDEDCPTTNKNEG
jgi:hypothetical protein